MALNAPLNRKLRMGLVGGGQGSFIGGVHSRAAIFDHRTALVAGALCVAWRAPAASVFICSACRPRGLPWEFENENCCAMKGLSTR